MPRTVKVAVIGSGLAGLTAAYMLSTEPPQGGVKFEVHLFEQSSTLGMDAHSVSIPTGGHGHESRIDVPMRSFQGGYYRRLIALYRHLGVRFRPTDFSYSFSFLTSDRRITTSLIYNGASGLRGLGIASSLRSSDKHNRPLDRLRAAASTYLSFALLCLLFLWNYVRLVALSAPAFRPRDAHRMSFRAWSDATVPRAPLARWLGLDAHWRAFTRDTLVPLFSAVCTASATDVLDHPAEEFLDYIWLTLFTHHYVASDGVRDVVARLAAPIHHVHLSSPITTIRPSSDDPTTATLSSATATFSGFAHVVLATQANGAAPLLETYAAAAAAAAASLLPADIAAKQAACLRRFRYVRAVVVNHTDDGLLPDDPRDRRDLNLITSSAAAAAFLSSSHSTKRFPGNDDQGGGEEEEEEEEEEEDGCVVPASYTMATHVIRAATEGGGGGGPAIYQTTDPIVPPRRDRVLSVAKLERAVLTLDSKDALRGLSEDVARRRPERRSWWRWRSGTETETRLGALQGGARSPRSSRREPGAVATGGPGVWMCGSYAHRGIPLLEGCVVSARAVVEQGILPAEGLAASGRPW